MKKGKTLLLLLVALTGVVIATVVIQNTERKKEEIKLSGETLFSLSEEDVTSLSITTGSDTLSFEKRDDKWYWSDDEAFPVDQDRIAEILSDYENFAVAFTIDNVSDYGQYGLSSPEWTVKLSGEDIDYTITMGDYSQMDEERYVSLQDGKAYLAVNDPSENLSVTISDYILNDTLPSLSTASGFKIASQGINVIKTDKGAYGYCSSTEYYNVDGGTYTALNSTKVASFILTVGDLELGDYLTYNASEAERELYGMNDATAINITYTDDDGAETTSVLYLYADEDGAYAKVDDSGIIYEVDADIVAEIQAEEVDDMREKSLVIVDWTSEVSRLLMVYEGNSYSFDITVNDDGDVVCLRDSDDEEEEAEEIDMRAFTSAIDDLTISEFTSTKTSGAADITFTLQLNNEAYPTRTVAIYQDSGTVSIVKVDDVTVGTIERSEEVSLIEALKSYLLDYGS